MNRVLLIIVGIILTLVLIAVWVYMLFFSNPTGEDRNFANLNLGNTDSGEVAPMVEESFEEEEVLVDVVDDSALRQLTTEPVIGFQEVMKDASSTPEVYYIKSGTGHVMSINLTTGEEKRVSGTTIPKADKGVISRDGKLAMVRAGQGISTELVAGSFSSSSEELIFSSVSESAIDFTITSDNELLFIQNEGVITTLRQFSLDSQSSNLLATIPFTDVSIDWGERSDSPHYIYPSANSRLEGYLYKIENGVMSRLPVDGYGLTAVGTDDYVLLGRQLSSYYQTSLFDNTSSSITPLKTFLLPEKCLWFGAQESFVCADSKSALKSNVPDIWYEGGVSYVDNFWQVPVNGSSTKMLIDTKAESGRELDIINLELGDTSESIYFQNKNDQTLWQYQLTN